MGVWIGLLSLFTKKKPLILGVMLPFVMIVSNFDSKRRQVKTSDSDWS